MQNKALRWNADLSGDRLLTTARLQLGVKLEGYGRAAVRDGRHWGSNPTLTLDGNRVRTVMLLGIQKSQCEQVGVVRLTAVFSESAAQRMCQHIWDFLAAKHGISPDDPATWTIRQPTGFQALTQSGAFNPIVSGPLVHALDQILGDHQWRKPAHWGGR
jgi:hypothetical protein